MKKITVFRKGSAHDEHFMHHMDMGIMALKPSAVVGLLNCKFMHILSMYMIAVFSQSKDNQKF